MAKNSIKPFRLEGFLRDIFKDVLNAIGGWLNKMGIKPNVITITGLVGNIVAGVPVLSEENYRGSVMLDDAIFPAGELFILQVSGDSMEGVDIHDGDFAVIRRQNTAESGDIAAVLVGDEATLKRIIFRDELLWLLPANPRYQPIVITPANDEIRILGKLVGLIRRY